MPLTGGQPTPLFEDSQPKYLEQFAVLGGQITYSDGYQNGYIICLFSRYSDSTEVPMLIIDVDGTVVYEHKEPVSAVRIYDGKAYIVKGNAS